VNGDRDFGKGRRGLLAPFTLAQPFPTATTGSLRPYAAPTISGTPTILSVAVVSGASTSAALSFNLGNQPTDGNLDHLSIYVRPTGVTLWTFAAKVAPQPLVGGIATYSHVTLTNLVNGVGYDFGVSYVARSNAESGVTFIGAATAAQLAFNTTALAGGNGVAPTLSGSVTFSQTASNTGITSDISVVFTLNNQPTDGSLYALALYFGTSGGTLSRYLLLLAQAGGTGTYTAILPAETNAVTYAFACNYVYTNNTESAQLSLGTYAINAVTSTFLQANVPNSTAYVTDAVIEFAWTGSGPYAVTIWYDNGTPATDSSVIFPDSTTINLGHTTSGAPSFSATGVLNGTNYYAVLSRLGGTTTMTVQTTPFTTAAFAAFFANGGIVPAAAQSKTPLFTASGTGGGGGHSGGGGGHVQ